VKWKLKNLKQNEIVLAVKCSERENNFVSQLVDSCADVAVAFGVTSCITSLHNVFPVSVVT